MPRGTDCTGEMPDCYNGTNKEEDKEVKQAKAVNDWWENMTPKEQYYMYCEANEIDY